MSIIPVWQRKTCYRQDMPRFFFLPDNIFSSLFNIKCQLLCFGTASYRYANPKMWFIHLRPPLPPTAKQIGNASTTAARGSSEHNQENYLARLQAVHRTDKQLPTTFFCSTSLIMLQTPLGNHILLLQYDSSPPLTTHFLIKCMNATFYRREKSLWVFRGSPVYT